MVVATATIALQNQVVDRDLPALVDAVEPLLGRRPTYAILKGRSNYLCRNKVLGGMPDDDERRAVRPVAHDGARPATSCGCAAGPTRPRPATATSSTPASTTGPGGRSASPRRECLGAAEVPVRRGVLRRAGPRPGGRGRDRGDQPRAARDRRAGELQRAARARRGGRRRGARAGRPGHRRRHRRADGRRWSSGPRRGRGGSSTAPRTSPTPRRRSRRRWPRCPRAGSSTCPSSWPPRSPWCATRRATVVSELGRGQGRRRRRAQGRAGGGRGGARAPPSGSPPTRRTTSPGCRTTRVAGRCSRSRRCRSTGCCARRCSASGRWC